MLSPTPATVKIASVVALIPEAQPIPQTPPSKAAILLSKAATVGFAKRV